MKNTTIKLILLLLLAIPLSSDAQKYRKMLGDSSVWYEVHVFEGAYTIIHRVYGDSLINGQHYQLVEHNSLIANVVLFLDLYLNMDVLYLLRY